YGPWNEPKATARIACSDVVRIGAVLLASARPDGIIVSRSALWASGVLSLLEFLPHKADDDSNANEGNDTCAQRIHLSRAVYRRRQPFPIDMIECVLRYTFINADHANTSCRHRDRDLLVLALKWPWAGSRFGAINQRPSPAGRSCETAGV